MRSQFQPSWDLAVAATFVVASAGILLPSLVYPWLLGSHAMIYTHAADAVLTGGDPWSVGPPAAIFAGPPTMLLPFLPFVGLPDLGINGLWLGIDLAIAIWVVRRLQLPAYWLAFPPLFQTIVLGHPEIAVLGLLVVGRAVSGLAVLIKPYAILPLLAERSWRAIGASVAAVALTAPFLPWPRFLAEFPVIVANVVRQTVGDSVFGNPIGIVVGVLALVSLGLRKALWLGVPVLWPFAQPNYKVMTLPVLPPILAIAWAIPMRGMTLAGVVVLAVLLAVDRWRPLPDWFQAGVRQRSAFHGIDDGLPGRAHATQPAILRAG